MKRLLILLSVLFILSSAGNMFAFSKNVERRIIDLCIFFQLEMDKCAKNSWEAGGYCPPVNSIATKRDIMERPILSGFLIRTCRKACSNPKSWYFSDYKDFLDECLKVTKGLIGKELKVN